MVFLILQVKRNIHSTSKALATTVLESIAGQFQLPNVSQASKLLKVSRFHSIAAGKPPSKYDISAGRP